jgi:phage tail protein X
MVLVVLDCRRWKTESNYQRPFLCHLRGMTEQIVKWNPHHDELNQKLPDGLRISASPDAANNSDYWQQPFLVAPTVVPLDR